MNQISNLFLALIVVMFLLKENAVLFGASNGKKEEIFIRPEEKIAKPEEKIPEPKKEISKKIPTFLDKALKLLLESLDQSKDSDVQIEKIQKAMNLLRENLKGETNIPGLDCLKKALYNMEKMKTDFAINNIKRAMIEIYEKIQANNLNKISENLSPNEENSDD